MRNKATWLSGHALFYALLLSVVIGVLCTMVLSQSVLYKGLQQRQIGEIKLLQNLEVAVHLLQASTNLNSKTQFPLDPENQKDSVELQIKQWGVLKIGLARAFQTNARSQHEVRKCVALGTPSIFPQSLSLIMPEDRRPLALCGHTTISGDVRLPENSPRKGSISGQPYIGKQLVLGQILQAVDQLPELSSRFNEECLEAPTASSANLASSLPDSAYRSFFDSTQIFQSDSIYLENEVFEGNIWIKAKEYLEVGRNCSLDMVVLQAPTIRIKSGFRGAVQCLASTQIILEPETQLTYPSGLIMHPKSRATIYESQFERSLVMESGSKVFGWVIQTGTPEQLPAKTYIKSRAKINGLLYSAGSVSLQGSVEGQAICRNFDLEISGRSYYNHLLNGEIKTVAGYSLIIPGNLFNSTNPEKWKLIRWLS